MSGPRKAAGGDDECYAEIWGGGASQDMWKRNSRYMNLNFAPDYWRVVICHECGFLSIIYNNNNQCIFLLVPSRNLKNATHCIRKWIHSRNNAQSCYPHTRHDR